MLPKKRDPMSLKDAMNKLFEESFWQPFGTMSAFDDMLEEAHAVHANFPDINMKETKKGVEVHASLAGYDPDDVEVEIHDGMLTLSGEMEDEKEDKEDTWHRREFSSGSFTRRIMLPEGLDEDKISAEMSKGVLTLKVPFKTKKAKSKPKSVKIKKR